MLKLQNKITKKNIKYNTATKVKHDINQNLYYSSTYFHTKELFVIQNIFHNKE